MPVSAAHPWKTLPVSMLTYVLLTQPLFCKRNYALPGNSMPSLPKGQGSDLASSVNSAWDHALTLQEGFMNGHDPDPWEGSFPLRYWPQHRTGAWSHLQKDHCPEQTLEQEGQMVWHCPLTHCHPITGLKIGEAHSSLLLSFSLLLSLSFIGR